MDRQTDIDFDFEIKIDSTLITFLYGLDVKACQNTTQMRALPRSQIPCDLALIRGPDELLCKEKRAFETLETRDM